MFVVFQKNEQNEFGVLIMESQFAKEASPTRMRSSTKNRWDYGVSPKSKRFPLILFGFLNEEAKVIHTKDEQIRG